MLDPGLGPAFPGPAPKLSNSAVVGSSPAANMSKVGAQSSTQPGSAANAGSLMHSSKARVLSNAVLKGPCKKEGDGYDMRVFAYNMSPNLSFDAFQEGGLALKGTRRRDAEAADVPVSVVEGVAMASLDG